MTFYELYKVLPSFLFFTVVLYTLLCLLRFKKAIKFPLWLILIGIVLIPGSFFMLPFLAIIEAGFQMHFFYKSIKN